MNAEKETKSVLGATIAFGLMIAGVLVVGFALHKLIDLLLQNGAEASSVRLANILHSAIDIAEYITIGTIALKYLFYHIVDMLIEIASLLAKLINHVINLFPSKSKIAAIAIPGQPRMKITDIVVREFKQNMKAVVIELKHNIKYAIPIVGLLMLIGSFRRRFKSRKSATLPNG